MMKSPRCRLLAVPIFLVAWCAVLGDEPLPRDPNNVYGEFENGLSYIVRKHDNPPGRVAFYLHVKTGALNEKETQNGIAHFNEHMAFNGSKHFAPGKLFPFLNKLGMETGQHTNAHTGYDETVYVLTMPDNKGETIEQALTILSDYADGLLFLPEEIDKERNVILEEARARKSPSERIRKELMKKVFAGTRLAVHDVIGDEAQIAEWSKTDFDDYYNTWYRPDNMTLIAVGDVDPQEIIDLAKKHLGAFKPRAASREPGKAGIKPIEEARAFVLTDPEQVMGMLQVMAIKAGRPPMKTYADYRFNEVENIGTWIVSRRLREMVEKGTAAFLGGNVFVSGLFHETILPMGSTVGQPQDWNRALEQLVVEINRAIEHGFTEREMRLARDEMLAEAEHDVETEQTQNAQTFLGQFSSAVGSDEPILSAQQRLDLLRKIFAEITLSQVHRVFVDNFKTNAYTYVLVMPEKKEGLTLPTPQDVLAAAAEAQARKTEPPQKKAEVDSILAETPKPGTVLSQETDGELKITTAKLSNGIVLHHRFMDYKKDRVIVNITIPGAQIEETAESQGASEIASLAFGQPATSRLDSTQVRDLLTGKTVQVSGDAGQDAFTISIVGSPKDMEIGFQLVHALLTDGRVEASAFDNWKKATLQRLEQEKTQWQGHLRRLLDEVVFAGDVRLSDLTAEQVSRLNAEMGERWLKRLAGGAGTEVAIVGDLSLDAGLALATEYLASLPKPVLKAERLDPLRKVSRGSGPYAKTIRFDTITPTAVAFAGFVSCDDRDVLDRRLLTMAARIVSDRMFERIREQERLVYSIDCRNIPAEAYPGLGMMFAAAPTDPEKAETLADRIIEMMKDFADKGPTDEELTTAKKQIANTLETSLKEPGFWADVLKDTQYRSRTLDELKDLPGVYDRFTAQQLQDVVKKYLKDDRVIRLVAIPRTTASASQPATEPQTTPAKTESKQPQPVGAGQ